MLFPRATAALTSQLLLFHLIHRMYRKRASLTEAQLMELRLALEVKCRTQI